jgi:hypothetical protein
MSGLDGLQLDADGFVDMDQFPDDGTDLGETDLVSLRDTLHSDPVVEPTDAEWDAMFDEVVTADDSGPFAVDGSDAPVDDGGDLFGAEAGEAAAEMAVDDGDAAAADDADLADDVAADDAAADLDLDASEDLAFDDVPADDVDVTADLDLDGGLDLTADDGLDDSFAVDAVDDVPADIANNDFEDLL